MNDPGRYEKYKFVIRNDLEDSVAVLLENMSPWKPKELILDYGCGPGSTLKKFFVPLAEQTFSHIHAVDISEEAVKYARKYFANDHVEYFQGNLLDDSITLSSVGYDRIFSIHVFHFIQDYK